MALNHGFLHQFTQEPSLATQIGSPSLESSLQGTEAPTNELSFKSVKYTDPNDWTEEDFAAYDLNVTDLGIGLGNRIGDCLLYTSPSPRDKRQSRMPSSA